MANIGSLIASIGIDTRRLRTDTNKTQSLFTGMSRRVIRDLAGITVGILGVQKAIQLVNLTFRTGFNAVEDYKKNTAALAAVTLTFLEKSKPIPELWARSLKHAQNLFPILEDIAAQTLVSGQNVNSMALEFAKSGQIIDANSKTQIQGLKNIANALFLITGGLDLERQIITEISAITRGQIKAQDKLGKVLLAIEPGIKEQLNIWRKSNTIIENVGKLLAGFTPATESLAKTWTAVKSTLETTANRVLRGSMLVVYTDIIRMALKLNKHVEENQEIITTRVISAYETLKETIKGILTVIQNVRKFTHAWGITFEDVSKAIGIAISVNILGSLLLVRKRLSGLITIAKIVGLTLAINLAESVVNAQALSKSVEKLTDGLVTLGSVELRDFMANLPEDVELTAKSVVAALNKGFLDIEPIRIFDKTVGEEGGLVVENALVLKSTMEDLVTFVNQFNAGLGLSKGQLGGLRGVVEDALGGLKAITPIDPDQLKKSIKAASFFITEFERDKRAEIEKTATFLEDALNREVQSQFEAAEKMRQIDEFRQNALKNLELERIEFFRQLREDELDNIIEHSQVFGEVVTAQIELWMMNIQTFAQATGDIITGIFDMVSEGIGNALADTIVEGKSLVEGLKNLAKDALKFIISTLVKLGVEKLIFAALQATTDLALHASKMAQISAVTYGIAFAQALPAGPGAAATYAGVVTGEMLAGSSVAAAAGGAVGATQGQLHAGIDFVPKEGSFLLDKGEAVLDSQLNQDLRSFLQSGNKGTSVTIELDGAVLARALGPFMDEAKGDKVNFG